MMMFQGDTHGTARLTAAANGLAGGAVDAVAADPSTVAVVPVGGLVTGLIDFDGDEDWIRVDLVAGNSYVVESGLDASVAGTMDETWLAGLFSDDGTYIDGTMTEGSWTTFTASDSGAHFISVQGFNGGTGGYVVTVTTDRVVLPGATSGADDLAGASVNENIFGRGGDDLLKGGGGDDSVVGGTGRDRVLGGAGHDSLWGNGDDDVLRGGGGQDTLVGGDGDDALSGGADADSMFGRHGGDILRGGRGHDYMSGGGGRDVLDGGRRADYLIGGRGDDHIDGGAGDDELGGDDGDDVLSGGDGDDWLNGGGGDDRIDGGTGDDRLVGGAGADVFAFATGAGADTVADFEPGIDSLAFRQADDLSDLALQDSDGGLRITVGGDSVLIVGVTAEQILAADGFLF